MEGKAMNEKGWIRLHRQFMDQPAYFSEPFCRNMAWVDLLLLANHKPGIIFKRGNKIELKPGEVGYAQDSLAERWKWSRGKVIRFLNDLQNDGQIVQQKSKVVTKIIIANYKRYQSQIPQDDTTESTTDGRQTDDRRYRNKNDKNDKNKIDSGFLNEFDRFRKKYKSAGGRVRGNETEFKEFKKHTDWKQELSKLSPAIDKLTTHRKAQVEQGLFTPSMKNLKTWLHQRCWEEEFPNSSEGRPTIKASDYSDEANDFIHGEPLRPIDN